MSGTAATSLRTNGRWDNSDRTAAATVGTQPHPVASALLMVGHGGPFVDNGCLDPDPSGSCCARLHRRGLRLMLFALIFSSGLAIQSAFAVTMQWLLPSHVTLSVLIYWTLVAFLLVATAIVASYLFQAGAQYRETEEEQDEDIEAAPARPPRKRKSGSASEPQSVPQRSRKRGEAQVVRSSSTRR